jgi:hypothetical protein
MARGWWARLWNGELPEDETTPQPRRASFPTDPAHALQESFHVAKLEKSISDLMAIDGATGAAVVDISSGMALASAGNPGFSLDVAAAGNSNVVRAKLKTMVDLELTETIDDILITLESQYHLINVLNEGESRGLFIYLVLNRNSANLALARHKLRAVSSAISL